MEVNYLVLILIIFAHTGVVLSTTTVKPTNNGNNICTGKNVDSPLNFKLKKSVDIQIESNIDKWNPELNNLIQTQIRENARGKSESSHISVPSESETSSVYEEEVRAEQSQAILKNLESLTNTIKNVQNYYGNFSCNDFSANNEDYNELCKNLVGISQPPICEIIEKRHAKITNNKILPKNCKEIQDNGNNKSGIYEIQLKHKTKPLKVLCDMDLKGGGWTHIQRRIDGSEDFYRDWRDYKFGFGDLSKEFWMGLENIYQLTGFEVNELLIEIIDRDKIEAYAFYTGFGIGSEMEGYPLNVLRGFSGDAGDSLTEHLSAKFTTKDMDQDSNPSNCAQLFQGAWWYKTCHVSNLNGRYLNMPLPAHLKFNGLHWKTFRGHEYCHASARMLIRPSRI